MGLNNDLKLPLKHLFEYDKNYNNSWLTNIIKDDNFQPNFDILNKIYLYIYNFYEDSDTYDDEYCIQAFTSLLLKEYPGLLNKLNKIPNHMFYWVSWGFEDKTYEPDIEIPANIPIGEGAFQGAFDTLIFPKELGPLDKNAFTDILIHHLIYQGTYDELISLISNNRDKFEDMQSEVEDYKEVKCIDPATGKYKDYTKKFREWVWSENI